MPIRQFRKDSKKGGFDTWHLSDAEMLLNPLSFQAVGKTRGWREKTENTFESEHTCWQAYWTGFYGHLADGLTIEDALTLLT